jgi:hypothetical protein
MQQFMYKWSYIPNIMANTKLGNTKLPPETDVRGIHFWDKPLDK